MLSFIHVTISSRTAETIRYVLSPATTKIIHHLSTTTGMRPKKKKCYSNPVLHNTTPPSKVDNLILDAEPNGHFKRKSTTTGQRRNLDYLTDTKDERWFTCTQLKCATDGVASDEYRQLEDFMMIKCL